jgi:gliding motility-associated-like protein
MESMLRFLLSITMWIIGMQSATGFHIAGGDLTTQHLSGNTFELRLTLYRDCSNPSAANFDPTIIIAAYSKLNNTLQDTFHTNLSFISPLQLSGAGCSPPPAVCMEQGDYIRQITLPPLAGGYYLVWERCCRNNTVTNLFQPDRTPMLFYHEMADPVFQNSSPVFNSPPLPYTCVGQFFRFNFNATDNDGDSLVYVLSSPMAGGYTSNFDPNPFSALNSPGGNNMPVPSAPYANSFWATGFSLNNICGSVTPITIDPYTGLAEGIPDFAGFFAMAVTVFEYRNGLLIGQIRREIEFTVINCIGNDAPNLSASVQDQNFEIYEADTLCFSITATDPDGDSVYLRHIGEVFAATPASGLLPPYAFSKDTAGITTVSTDFCWYTVCGQARDSVYKLQFEITDNGCPIPLLAVKKITISVKEVPPINKPNLLCLEITDSIIKIHKSPQPEIIPRLFRQFNLYRSLNGSPFQLIQQSTDAAQVLFTDTGINDPFSNDYCYYMTGINTCGEISLHSDTLCTTSQVNRNVNYIVTSTVLPGDLATEIKWADFPDGPYSTYIIERRFNDLNESWTETARLNNYSAYSLIDNAVFPDRYSYCYRMKNIDFCKNESAYSNEACTILLSGEANQFSNTLQWTPYKEWLGGVNDYELSRASEGTGFDFFTLQTGPSTLISTEDNELDPQFGRNRYAVVANEGSGGYLASSRSNEIELSQGPLLYIPNAFTPNNDEKNETWFPRFSFVNELQVTIFNRWGQQVFSGDKNAAGWDGSYRSAIAPEGVYGYKITYTGFSENEKYEKTGVIHLVR